MQDPSSFIADLQSVFPGLVVVPKSSSSLMRLIDRFLRVVSFGRISTFMTDYATTIGRTIYTPSNFSSFSPARQSILLQHEAVHVEQSRRFTPVFFAFLYLFFPLPFFFAYARFLFERQAYAVTIRQSALHYGLDLVRTSAFRNFIINQFVGPAYLFTWIHRPSVESWFDSVIQSVAADIESSHLT